MAARAYLAAGDGDRARAVVLDAPSPGLVGHALLVEVLGLVHGDDASAENLAAIERAAADLSPSAERTERLMGLAYACRDAPSGLAFGRRLLGLRPGDTAALGAFLECLVSHNGPSEIAETIAWILSLPYDASTLATVMTRGLGALENSGTAELRMRVARRAFDVVGAMDAAVRGLLVHTGKSSKEFAFSAMVVGRALSCGEGRGWPERLVPLCDWGCGAWACVDEHGRVVTMDEHGPTKTSYTLHSWLEAWLAGVDLQAGAFELVDDVMVNPFTKEPMVVKRRGRARGEGSSP